MFNAIKQPGSSHKKRDTLFNRANTQHFVYVHVNTTNWCCWRERCAKRTLPERARGVVELRDKWHHANTRMLRAWCAVRLVRLVCIIYHTYHRANQYLSVSNLSKKNKNKGFPLIFLFFSFLSFYIRRNVGNTIQGMKWWYFLVWYFGAVRKQQKIL
jgi:hypothetical protein